MYEVYNNEEQAASPAENLQQFAWYYGEISREEAEVVLLEKGQDEGTFLIRDARPADNAKQVPKLFRLSVLEWRLGQCKVMHSKIEVNQRHEYYLNRVIPFRTLSELVRYYQVNSLKSGVRLTIPCPRTQRRNTAGVEIPRDKLIFKEKISSHREKPAEVWKATLSDTGKHVAVKVHPNGGEEGAEQIVEQVSVLKILRHENIVRLVGVVTPCPACLLTEYQPNRDLLSFMLANTTYQTSFDELLRISTEVASALAYMVSSGFVHRNVRSANVLLDNDLSTKLSGFTYAGSLNENGYYFAKTDEVYDNQMYRWMAIEGAADKRFSEASDVWSYGMFLYELFTNGEPPLADVLIPHLARSIATGVRPVRKPSIPSSAYGLMEQSWLENPFERPSFQVVIKTLKHMNEGGTRTNRPPLTSKYPQPAHCTPTGNRYVGNP